MGLKRWGILAAALLPLAWPFSHARAQDSLCGAAQDSLCGAVKVSHLHHMRIRGQIVDLTQNHGCDRRIWSRSLYQKRDLYVYLPPCYDANQAYPVVMYLHGFATDEQSFLQIAPIIDDAICKGKLPPVIVAAPDGSLDGHGCLTRPGSFWINSNAGCYEDFVLFDVWDYLTHHYSIRPEPGAHVLAGVSMGGFGAFNLGIRHRDCFGVVAGVFPPLNLRWQNCECDPHAEFDPRSWSWRAAFDREHEVVARLGVAAVRMGDLIRPVFGSGDEALAAIIDANPIELVDRTRLKNGELQMFIAYAARDEFNIGAQVESFLYLCKHRGIGLHVACDPNGRHDPITAMRLTPALIDWLGQQLAPYGACGACGGTLGRPTMLP
jgi:S-formylglutathione hydrolase FrmB